jgi:hypothetical protein
MLCSFVNPAANPAKSLESHSCTLRTHNSPGITLLRKNRGRGYPPATPREDLIPISAPFGTSLFDDLHLADWIHHPSNRMQQSPAPPLSAPRPAMSFSCRGGARSARRQHVHDVTAAPLIPERCLTAARHSVVDTTHRLPYSAPANDFANPSPPSSSRHSAAFDEVCIADSLTQDSHHPLAQRPSGFFVFMPDDFAGSSQRRKRQDKKKSQDERTRCNSTSPNPTD